MSPLKTRGPYAHQNSLQPSLDNHVFHFLQRTNPDDVASRFCLENRFLACEWVDALPGLGRWFAFDLNLHKPREGELAHTALLEVAFDQCRELVKYR